jgi:hypothetical protein
MYGVGICSSPIKGLEDFYRVVYYYEKKIVWLDLLPVHFFVRLKITHEKRRGLPVLVNLLSAYTEAPFSSRQLYLTFFL